jgi:hypothetical protein
MEAVAHFQGGNLKAQDQQKTTEADRLHFGI